MTLTFMLAAIRRHAVLVLALTCAGAVAAALWTFVGPRHYTSTSVVLIGTAEVAGTDTTGLNDYVVSRMSTYAQLASTAAVLDKAGIPASVIGRVGQVGTSALLSLSVSGRTAAEAQANDQALIDAFATALPQLNKAADGIALVIQPIDPPSRPTNPDPPSGGSLWLTAVAGGLLLGIVAACGCEIVLATRDATPSVRA